MFDRIVSNPNVLGGKPCIKGTRLSVEFILALLASGGARPDIVRNYPVTDQDVEQALQYAARFLQNEVVIATEFPS